MPIIPIMRCRSMPASVAFYTGILDFERADGEDDPEDCSVILLRRGADELCLSSDDDLPMHLKQLRLILYDSSREANFAWFL